MVSILAVQIALENCMAVEHTGGFSLSSDANELTTLFAEMRYFKETERDVDLLVPDQRAAFERWKTTA